MRTGWVGLLCCDWYGRSLSSDHLVLFFQMTCSEAAGVVVGFLESSDERDGCLSLLDWLPAFGTEFGHLKSLGCAMPESAKAVRMHWFCDTGWSGRKESSFQGVIVAKPSRRWVQNAKGPAEVLLNPLRRPSADWRVGKVPLRGDSEVVILWMTAECQRTG